VFLGTYKEVRDMGTLRKLRRISHTHKSRFESIPWELLPYARKMSEVLLEFAEPLLEDSDDDESFRNKIALAALSWNLTCVPSNEQEATLNNMVEKLGGRDAFIRRGIQESIHMLMDRKRTLFANDNRLIINYEIVEEKTGPRLLVMSSPVKNDEVPSP
jgi:hypothetical protein